MYPAFTFLNRLPCRWKVSSTGPAGSDLATLPPHLMASKTATIGLFLSFCCQLEWIHDVSWSAALVDA